MELEKIETDFVITLKEIKAESKVILLLKDDNEGKEIQVPLQHKMILTFNGSISLDINKNYTINVIEVSQDGGMAQLNSVVLNAYLQEQFSQNRLIDISEATGSDQEQRSDNRTFIANSYGIEALDALVVASSNEPLAPEERPMVSGLTSEEIEKKYNI